MNDAFTFRLVTDDAGLRSVVDTLADVADYAVDTEFHRERTYYPKLALVQIAWPGDCVLVDPLAVDIAPLAEVLDGPGTAVVHSASQDLEVLQLACGTTPSRLFDTQVAAGFVGFSTPSLSSLAERILGVEIEKSGRMTDWLRRPLTPEQLVYAAGDVEHLLEMTEALRGELAATGRLEWAEEECELLRSRGWGLPDPDRAWLKLKEARGLRGDARGVAQEVAAWRERRAAEVDQPVRRVMADLVVVGLAGNPPRDIDGLGKIRGIDAQHRRGKQAEELLAAVERGRHLPGEAIHRPRTEDVPREARPAVALVSAWLAQVGRDLRIDPSLLATRSDLASFVAGEDTSRLGSGWRQALLGDTVRRLLAGEVAVAFDGGGRLALEVRSGQPVATEAPVPSAAWATPT